MDSKGREGPIIEMMPCLSIAISLPNMITPCSRGNISSKYWVSQDTKVLTPSLSYEAKSPSGSILFLAFSSLSEHFILK
jgi:hypothetical protein